MLSYRMIQWVQQKTTQKKNILAYLQDSVKCFKLLFFYGKCFYAALKKNCFSQGNLRF